MSFWETLKAQVAKWLAPILFVALILALATTYYEGRKAGQYAVMLREARANVDSLIHDNDGLARQVEQIDRIAHSEGARADDAVARYAALRHRRVDSTAAPMDSGNVIATADTAIAACTEARQTCAQQVAERDSLAAGLRRENAALAHEVQLLSHPPRSFFSGPGGKALLLGAGFLLGRALH